MDKPGYKLVRLASGAQSVHSLAHHETFHPVIGPVAEADALYVRQLRLAGRASRHSGEFVIWDVGLGAAANPLTVLRSLRASFASIRIVSFDQTLEPLAFALGQTQALDYLQGYETHLTQLLSEQRAVFDDERLQVFWEVHVHDFPSLLAQPKARQIPTPHAILFDAYSPAKNPEMWSQKLFDRIFKLLHPDRPCSLATYSRSTMLRATLLLSGFYVGRGLATGEKEETTVAANAWELIESPLDRAWLAKARRSTSAEPLADPVYRQARLSAATWERLLAHEQFSRRL